MMYKLYYRIFGHLHDMTVCAKHLVDAWVTLGACRRDGIIDEWINSVLVADGKCWLCEEDHVQSE